MTAWPRTHPAEAGAAARMLVAFAAAWLAAPAAAEFPVGDPAIVPLFEEACLKGGLTLEAREAALASGGWKEVPAGELKLKFLERNPLNGDFAKTESVRQWTRDAGGREIRAVLAKFRVKGGYPRVPAPRSRRQSLLALLGLVRQPPEAPGREGEGNGPSPLPRLWR